MVRQVRPDEAEQLRELRLRALRDAPRAFVMTAAQEAADPVERWERLARGGPNTAVFVDDGWRGMVGAQRDGDGVELWGLWVAPDARGTGLGAALVDAVRDWAGDARVQLCVMDAAPALIGFYTALGFTPAGPPRPMSSQPDRVIQSLIGGVRIRRDG